MSHVFAPTTDEVLDEFAKNKNRFFNFYNNKVI